ncbi:mevalonate kinase [Candidatus Woesebacteria bacterium]|nr:mevalonate kinase [Candidatus Woesebacteria bacterium]
MITASAPGKLLLFGDHSVVYGHPCIVTAVDQRIHVSVRKNGVDVFHLEAPDLGLNAYSKTIEELGKKDLPKSVAFVEMCYKRFLEKFPQSEGIIVTTHSEFSSQFGFGSSSAVTVAFAKALTELYGLSLSKKELFELCYKAVIDVQGVGSGFDIAAAIWGGTLYYVSPAQVVEPVVVNSLPLMIGYTGIKADTPTLIRMVESLRNRRPKAVEGIFTQITDVVNMAVQAIRQEQWEFVGTLMTKNHQLLCELQVSSIRLEELIRAANQAGALGSKLSGAGGGDCMVALVLNDQERIKQAIEAKRGEVLSVSLQAPGVRVEK